MELSEEEKKAFKELEDFIDNHEIQNISVFTAEKIKNIIENQQKEIEEKSTIIMVGAEKVKQLEKGNRSLMESRIKWKNRYYKEKAKNKEYISKDKIREKIEKYEKNYIRQDKEELFNLTKITAGALSALQELLEEK